MRWLAVKYVNECRRSARLEHLAQKQGMKLVCQAQEIARLKKLVSEQGVFIRLLDQDEFPPPEELAR